MLTSSFSPRRPKSAILGFSLVEVTLAIGIVAFAFISLFGLLPTGMNVFKGSIDATLGTQISQEVVEGVRQTDFESLKRQSQTSDDGTHLIKDTYYDEQGNLLLDTGATPPVPITSSSDPRSIYTVRTVVIMPTNVPAGSGGATTNGVTNTSNVARVIVKIAKNPGHAQDPFTNGRGNTTTYTAYIARNLSAFEFDQN